MLGGAIGGRRPCAPPPPCPPRLNATLGGWSRPLTEGHNGESEDEGGAPHNGCLFFAIYYIERWRECCVREASPFMRPRPRFFFASL